ncbi:MAG: sigma-54-dependent Fis family transcriptional regulator, partial [Desulfobacterales bacterium]|nr:sigma-54-dependent Fis family transcriptional regulator [Desulfobacterales bacterium]
LEPDMNCSVHTAPSGEAALKAMSETIFDLILADIKMPGMNGLELLEIIKRNNAKQTVIMMTAHGSIDAAVQAIKNGAYDFITKPFEHDALVIRLEKALERSSLLKENKRLQAECGHVSAFQELVGKSACMKKVYETIQTVAKTNLTVLITGESGTGKDLTARAVHALSLRGGGPFVAVNCPTVPEQILESELFGYKKGAFTHATQNKIGLFQEARGGSIFLDEIGDISPTIQTKLLRVLQEKEIKPLGDTKTVYVDARIIASTNQDLKKKIEKSEFREDFYYRLNVLPIRLPSLREHPEDIPLIADHLLMKHSAELEKPLKRISPELMRIFREKTWVGNVRELENVILRGILFSVSDEITPGDIDAVEGKKEKMTPESAAGLESLPYKEAKEESLRRFNTAYIGRLLSDTSGNVTRAAKNCGMERQALQQIMRRFGISASPYRDQGAPPK